MGMTGKTTNCFLKNEWKNAGNNHQNFMVLAGFFSLTCGNHVNMSSLSLTTLLLRESSDKPLPPYVTKTIWGDTHLALVLQLKFEKQNNFEVFYSSPHHTLFYEHQLISLPSFVRCGKGCHNNNDINNVWSMAVHNHFSKIQTQMVLSRCFFGA